MKRELIVAILFFLGIRQTLAGDLEKAKDSGLKEGDQVHILWVRHGFSCANLIDSLSRDWTNYFRNTYAPDPRVTDIGRDYAMAAASHTEEIFNSLSSDENSSLSGLRLNQNNIYVSTLLRTMETAVAWKSGWKGMEKATLKVIPHISEQRAPLGDRDNQPRNWNLVRKDLDIFEKATQDKFSPFVIEPFQFGAYFTSAPPPGWFHTPQIHDPVTNAPSKVRFLSESLVRMAKEDTDVANSDLVTVLVSHNHFITAMTGSSPGNVGAILQSFEFSNGFFSPLEGTSTVLFKGYEKLKAENLLNHHFESCRFREDPGISEIVKKNAAKGGNDAAVELKAFFRFF